MTEQEREAKKARGRVCSRGNKMFGMSPDEVKPGLHREPFSAPENVLVMVAGSGADARWCSRRSGSTARRREVVRPT